MPNSDVAALERLAAEAYQNVRKFQHEKPKHKAKPPPEWEKKLNGVRHVLGDMAHHVEDILHSTEAAISTAGVGTIFGHLTTLWSHSANLMGSVTDPHNAVEGAALESLGEPFVRVFIEDSLGINLNPEHSGAGDARATVARMAGFVIAFQFAWAGFVALGKTVLCDRFPEVLAESIGKLGEELGLNFAIGEILSTLFEQAVGRPIEESINMQLHPNRPDLMMLRAITRQGHLSPGEFMDAANRMGYENKWVELLLQMDTRQLPISLLLQMHEAGVMGSGEIQPIMHAQGYEEADINLVIALSNAKGVSAGATFLRSVARSEAEAGHISTGQFASILAEVGASKEEVKLEVEAIELHHAKTASHVSMSVLKKLYVAKEIGAGQVNKVLAEEGYTEQDIAWIIQSWEVTKSAATKHIPPGTIAHFYKAGAMDRGTAISRIEELGYSSTDATAYIVAAETKPGSTVKPLSRGEVISAYRYKVIDYGTASSLLGKTGANEGSIFYLLATADKMPVKHKKNDYKNLSEADVVKIVKAGLENTGWAYDQFIGMNYSPDDATLLMELNAPPEGGGDFGPLPPPEEPPTIPGTLPIPHPIIHPPPHQPPTTPPGGEYPLRSPLVPRRALE